MSNEEVGALFSKYRSNTRQINDLNRQLTKTKAYLKELLEALGRATPVMPDSPEYASVDTSRDSIAKMLASRQWLFEERDNINRQLEYEGYDNAALTIETPN